MRIVFMGTPAFALPSLRKLLDHGYAIVGVVTTPDKPRGRGRQLAHSPVKQLALERRLNLLQPARLNEPSFITSLAALKADLFVVVAFRILPPEVYTLPPLGAFNLHASLLPRYRGAAPIHWAIINGETETGVTTFFLQERVDTGSIILQARVAIGPEETAGELHDRLAEIGAEVVLHTVRLIESGKAHPRPQDEAQASSAPKIFREHCRIDWSKSSARIHNLVRGLSPLPCAWTTHRNITLKIYRTSPAETPHGQVYDVEAGSVVIVEPDRLLVRTGDGAIAIREIQQEGRRRMGVTEFLRGYRLNVGERFE